MANRPTGLELVKAGQRPKSNSFYLDVPFNDQNDNSGAYHGPGYRQCNATSNAMLLEYLNTPQWQAYKKANPSSDFANAYGQKLSYYGDTTDHDANTACLAFFGVESSFIRNGSIDTVARSLYMGKPVVVGTKYKVSGHIKILIGRSANYVVAHDPYGVRNGCSDSWVSIGNNTGAYDQLSYRWLNQCLFDLGSSAGWMRIVK